MGSFKSPDDRRLNIRMRRTRVREGRYYVSGRSYRVRPELAATWIAQGVAELLSPASSSPVDRMVKRSYHT